MRKVLLYVVVILVIAGVGGYFTYNHFVSSDTTKADTATDEKATKTGKAPSVAEAEKIAKQSYEKMLSVMYDAADENDWYSYSNDIDYEVFADVMEPYATDDFFYEVSTWDKSALFCECDSFYMIPLDFESRTKVINVQTDTIRVRTFSIDGVLNDSSQAFLDFKNENGKWKVHRYSLVYASDKPLNITKEEAERYLLKYHPDGVKYLKEANYSNGDRIIHAYLFYLEDEDTIYAIDSDDGFMSTEVPAGLVPEEWRNKLYEYKY